MVKNKILSFILFTITTFSASFIGGLVTITLKEPWYSQLIKSNFNPPDWIFMQDERVAINRAKMTKFGIKVAELTVMFVKD